MSWSGHADSDRDILGTEDTRLSGVVLGPDLEGVDLDVGAAVVGLGCAGLGPVQDDVGGGAAGFHGTEVADAGSSESEGDCVVVGRRSVDVVVEVAAATVGGVRPAAQAPGRPGGRAWSPGRYRGGGWPRRRRGARRRPPRRCA